MTNNQTKALLKGGFLNMALLGFGVYALMSTLRAKGIFTNRADREKDAKGQTELLGV